MWGVHPVPHPPVVRHGRLWPPGRPENEGKVGANFVRSGDMLPCSVVHKPASGKIKQMPSLNPVCIRIQYIGLSMAAAIELFSFMTQGSPGPLHDPAQTVAVVRPVNVHDLEGVIDVRIAKGRLSGHVAISGRCPHADEAKQGQSLFFLCLGIGEPERVLSKILKGVP